MQIRDGKVPRARQLARPGQELSRAACARLLWMDFYHTHARNAALTCRRFGMSRQTFYRWKHRFDPHRLTSLEGRSHRPAHLDPGIGRAGAGPAAPAISSALNAPTPKSSTK